MISVGYLASAVSDWAGSPGWPPVETAREHTSIVITVFRTCEWSTTEGAVGSLAKLNSPTYEKKRIFNIPFL